MRRFRFQLGTLVILVLLIGVGFAALRESNEMWDSSIFSITLGLLLISILLAVHRTEKQRAFWLGFALSGSAYLGFSLVPSIESRLITTKALAYLDSKMPRSVPSSDPFEAIEMAENSFTFPVKNANGGWEDRVVTGSTPSFLNIVAVTSLMRSSGTTENFVRIGHSLLALIVASLGGYISRYLYTKNREAVRESIVPQGSTSSDRSGS
jgi:hypothetical protein